MRTIHKRRKKGLKAVGKAIIFILIALVFVAYVFPLFWMVIASFKTKVQIFDPVPKLFFKPTLINYKVFLGIAETGEVGAAKAGATTSFIAAMGRSIIITASATLCSLILGTMAGYVLSRFDMKAKGDLMFFVLSTRMLPPIVILVPLSLLFTNLGLKDTFFGFLLLYTNFNLAFSVWIMKSFFDDIPFTFEEAAMCDGYPRIWTFVKVVLPLVKPGLSAAARRKLGLENDGILDLRRLASQFFRRADDNASGCIDPVLPKQLMRLIFEELHAQSSPKSSWSLGTFAFGCR